MTSTPCLRLSFTDSALRAWAATRLSCIRPTSHTASISASVITVWCARLCGTNSSPEGLILSVSTPSRTISRAVLRNSSGPSQTMAKASRCMCRRRTSPSPAVVASSGLAARVRGPGMSPASMALRITTSRRALADAALLHAVNPCSRSFLAFLAVRSVCSSGGTKPRLSRSAVSRKVRCEWASTSPGINVAPPPSTTWAPSEASGAPCGATALMRLPSTSTWPVNGGAPVQSSTVTFLNRTLAMVCLLLHRNQVDPGLRCEKFQLSRINGKRDRAVDLDRPVRRHRRLQGVLSHLQGDDLLHAVILYPVDPAFKSPARPHHDVLGTHAERQAVEAGGQPVCDFGRHRYLELPGRDRHLAATKHAGHQVHGRRADKGGHEGIARPVVDLMRGADLDEAATIEHAYSVAHAHGLDLIVGDVEEGGAELHLQILELGAQDLAQFGVQVGQRLVHEENPRLPHDRAAEGDALHLAAGKSVGLALQ